MRGAVTPLPRTRTPSLKLQHYNSQRKLTEQQVEGLHFMDGETEAWRGIVTPTASGLEPRSPASQAGTFCASPRSRW